MCALEIFTAQEILFQNHLHYQGFSLLVSSSLHLETSSTILSKMSSSNMNSFLALGHSGQSQSFLADENRHLRARDKCLEAEVRRAASIYGVELSPNDKQNARLKEESRFQAELKELFKSHFHLADDVFGGLGHQAQPVETHQQVPTVSSPSPPSLPLATPITDSLGTGPSQRGSLQSEFPEKAYWDGLAAKAEASRREANDEDRRAGAGVVEQSAIVKGQALPEQGSAVPN